MKIHNDASGVESYSVLFQVSQSTINDLCLSKLGGGEGHCPSAVQNDQTERALEPLVESWSKVLPHVLDGSFASDGFGLGLHFLKLLCDTGQITLTGTLCLSFPD